MFSANETLKESLLDEKDNADDLFGPLDEKKEDSTSTQPTGNLSLSLSITPPSSPQPRSPEIIRYEYTLTEREDQLKEIQACLKQLAAMRRYHRPAKLCHALILILFVANIGTLLQANVLGSRADKVFATYNSTVVPATFNTTCTQQYPDSSCHDFSNMTAICYELFQEYCADQQAMTPWLIATLALFLGLSCGTCWICGVVILCFRDPTYLFGELCDPINWNRDEEYSQIADVADQHNISLRNKTIDDVYKAFSRQEKILLKMLTPIEPSLVGSLLNNCFRRRTSWGEIRRRMEIPDSPVVVINKPPVVNRTSYNEKTRKREEKRIVDIALDDVVREEKKYSFR